MATNLNAIQYVNPINLGGNELINSLLEKLTTHPESPVAGRMYFNTTDNTIYFYNGTGWVDAGGSTGTSVAVIVEAGYTTLASYVASAYNPADFKHGDLLVLSDSTDPGQRVWINLGIDNGDVNDFTAMSNAYDETEIKAMFSAGTGLDYTNGQFSISTGGVNTTQLADGSVTKAKIASDVAGNGLGQNVDGSLEVKVDGQSIKIIGDTLTVDGDVVGNALAGNGIVKNGTTLDVNVDNATIEIVADTLQVKDGSITETKLSTEVQAKLDRNGTAFNLASTGVSGVSYSNGAYTIVHNFNTRSVAVVMRDKLNSYRQIPTNNDAPSVNSVRVYFAEQPVDSQYEVTIIPMVF
ncbi:MAG: hypothetical protein ACRCX8_03450 [Sarcina sp.]